MPSSVRLPTEGFLKRTHLEGRYKLVARIGFPGGWPPDCFQSLEKGVWGKERQEGAQDFFTILHFGPGDPGQICSSFYLAA